MMTLLACLLPRVWPPSFTTHRLLICFFNYSKHETILILLSLLTNRRSNKHSSIEEVLFTDYLNDPEDYTVCNDNNVMKTNESTALDSRTASFESCLSEKKWESSDWNYTLSDVNFGGEDGGEEGAGTEMEPLDFQFLDNIVYSCYYSPFEIAAEIEEPVDPSMLRAAMKRKKYERKFTASPYAFNGIPECLKLRLESGNVKSSGKSEQLTKLQNACNNKNIEMGKKIAEEEKMKMMRKKEEENLETSNTDGESSLFGVYLIFHLFTPLID